MNGTFDNSRIGITAVWLLSHRSGPIKPATHAIYNFDPFNK